MASSYYSESRILMIRLQAGFLRCNDIVKEFVEIKLSETLTLPRADFSTTWRRWCHENIAFISKYQFWKKLAKEEDDGEEIPVFEEGDITFFSYLMKKIVRNCPGVEKLREFRNAMAHDTRTEIEEQMDFDDLFRQIEDGVNLLFHEDAL